MRITDRKLRRIIQEEFNRELLRSRKRFLQLEQVDGSPPVDDDLITPGVGSMTVEGIKVSITDSKNIKFNDDEYSVDGQKLGLWISIETEKIERDPNGEVKLTAIAMGFEQEAVIDDTAKEDIKNGIGEEQFTVRAGTKELRLTKIA